MGAWVQKITTKLIISHLGRSQKLRKINYAGTKRANQVKVGLPEEITLNRAL